MKQEIRLILSDLDGTLLPSDKIMTEYTKKMIHKLKEKRYLFGIASGRPLPPLKEKMRRWQMDGCIDIWIGNNGTEYEDSDGYFLQENFLSIENAQEIYQRVKDLPVSCGVFNDERKALRVSCLNSSIEKVAANNYYSYSIEDMEKVLKEKEYPKIFVTETPEKMDAVEKKLKEIEGEDFYGVRSGGLMFEFINRKASKSKGIARVCEHRKLKMENIMVIGDGDNDIEMLKDAGIAVVMANGSASAKAVADLLAGNNDEEGWGRFIESYFQL